MTGNDGNWFTDCTYLTAPIFTFTFFVKLSSEENEALAATASDKETQACGPVM